MASDIFLSYCRADRPLAEEFVRAAGERGVTVWFDEKIEGGEDWRRTIVDALGSAKALVILFSDHSNASDQLIKELAVADSLKKLVIPVLVSNCEPAGAYLYELASRNWVSIHPNPETRLDHLVEDLKTQLGARVVGTAPATIPTKADAPSPTLPPVNLLAPIPKIANSASLKRYDFYVLAPLLIASIILALATPGESRPGSHALVILAVLFYLCGIAVRNARSNLSMSWRLFGLYTAAFYIALAPAFINDPTVDGLAVALLATAMVAVPVAVMVSGLQGFLRRVFQQTQFRSRVRPVGG